MARPLPPLLPLPQGQHWPWLRKRGRQPVRGPGGGGGGRALVLGAASSLAGVRALILFCLFFFLFRCRSSVLADFHFKPSVSRRICSSVCQIRFWEPSVWDLSRKARSRLTGRMATLSLETQIPLCQVREFGLGCSRAVHLIHGRAEWQMPGAAERSGWPEPSRAEQAAVHKPD